MVCVSYELEFFYFFISNLFYSLESQDHIELLTGSTGEPLFFKQRDGPFVPVLRLLHKCEPFLIIISFETFQHLLQTSRSIFVASSTSGQRRNKVCAEWCQRNVSWFNFTRRQIDRVWQGLYCGNNG